MTVTIQQVILQFLGGCNLYLFLIKKYILCKLHIFAVSIRAAFNYSDLPPP